MLQSTGKLYGRHIWLLLFPGKQSDPASSFQRRILVSLSLSPGFPLRISSLLKSSESTNSGQGKYLGNFTLTAYCNCAQCCGTAGNLTASGTVPAAGRTVAMAGVPFGTQLLINGNVYTVEDLGTPYGHVDIFFDNHSDALSFGLQSAEVYQLN